MSNVEVFSKTQSLVVGVPEPGSVSVLSKTQRIIVGQPTPGSVRIVTGGQIGPPGMQGEQGPPGQDANTAVDLLMANHVASPTPHPAYDDISDLTILLENGLY